ncbi:MAG: type II CRISPR-associated endonuclease Cas1 [Bacteroidales bacterium]|jgi:CRISPR-associated protein Cas1|nr:type II CRISPR-associated endonuclease Cas1 [Bacteroidales bacterium]
MKKTLYFENPAYLSLKNRQLVIKLPEVEKNDALPESFKSTNITSIPVEDIGFVVLDNKQITITQGLLEALLQETCILLTCDSSHMPTGLLLPLESNNLQSERFNHQINASVPLKKQLWQQIITAKIINQAYVLQTMTSSSADPLLQWATRVRSGDSGNMEARAAAYYWANLFANRQGFTRKRDGIAPNNLLNYGYAVLRAVVARSLVVSGLFPTFGIHHHNRYNAYCLADDIMEPYRPFVDKSVVEIVCHHQDIDELSREIKQKLLSVPVLDVMINNNRSPLAVAVKTTTDSLRRCFAGEIRKIVCPTFVV